MIEQIPTVIYAVSLDRTKKFVLPLATVSVHHVDAVFYFGYAVIENGDKNRIFMATPEKALLDVLYLSTAKTRIFAALPELELPKTFNYKLCEMWINKIPYKNRRTLVAKKYEQTFSTAL